MPLKIPVDLITEAVDNVRERLSIRIEINPTFLSAGSSTPCLALHFDARTDMSWFFAELGSFAAYPEYREAISQLLARCRYSLAPGEAAFFPLPTEAIFFPGCVLED